MKAQDFLRKGADLLEERGKQYDQPGGERSMGKAVKAFNAITGRDLTEPEGWLLLQVLKDVRQWQNPGSYHADSAEDCVSYAALKAEALASLSVEPAAAMQDDSERMAVIGQNGEMAAAVYAAVDGWIPWSGGECPVGRDVVVDVKFCDGSVDSDSSGAYGWDHSGKDYSIVAYRTNKDATQ